MTTSFDHRLIIVRGITMESHITICRKQIVIPDSAVDVDERS